jgi:hypothetical protein
MSESLAITGGGLGFDTFYESRSLGCSRKGPNPEKERETKDAGKGREKARTLKVGRIIDTPKSN